MTEAHMKRSGEQQEFLTSLRREACDAAEDQSERSVFFLFLVQELLKHFIAKSGAFVPPLKHKTAESERIRGFCGEILAKIDAFSRTPEEAEILKKRFLESSLEFALSPVESAYLYQEVHEQKRLYAGHNAMDEVEL